MRSSRQPIEIVGGGLAGLSLALALQRAGVPVIVFEAGHYPRHRVCGEFITGLRAPTIARLGLGPFLADAQPHREVTWFQGEHRVCTQELPETAWAISRYVLDERLAKAFVAAGGELRAETRVASAEPRPGRIDATGRRRTNQPWLGLKFHVRGLVLATGLELHLGRDAYVGLCRLEGGVVNVSGLFKRRALDPAPANGALLAYLRASGLAPLAGRIVAAEICEETQVAVAGIGFGRPPRTDEVRLGDAYGMLPPFLGNGMASAFQMAEEALEPLARWSARGGDWDQTCAVIQHRIRRRFQRRMFWANFLHPFLLQPAPQRWLARLARGPRLPLNLLYRAMH